MYDCLDGLTAVSIRSCCQRIILSEGFSLSRLVGQTAVLIRSTPLCVASLASGGIISNRFVALLRLYPTCAKCIGILTTSFLVIVFNSTSTSISSTPHCNSSYACPSHANSKSRCPRTSSIARSVGYMVVSIRLCCPRVCLFSSLARIRLLRRSDDGVDTFTLLLYLFIL